MTKPKYLDMTAIPTRRARAQAIISVCAYFLFCIICVATFAVAVVLPIMVDAVTASTVWTSMTLEAVSAGSFFVARWIKTNAILGDGYGK